MRTNKRNEIVNIMVLKMDRYKHEKRPIPEWGRREREERNGRTRRGVGLFQWASVHGLSIAFGAAVWVKSDAKEVRALVPA